MWTWLLCTVLYTAVFLNPWDWTRIILLFPLYRLDHVWFVNEIMLKIRMNRGTTEKTILRMWNVKLWSLTQDYPSENVTPLRNKTQMRTDTPVLCSTQTLNMVSNGGQRKYFQKLSLTLMQVLTASVTPKLHGSFSNGVLSFPKKVLLEQTKNPLRVQEAFVMHTQERLY